MSALCVGSLSLVAVEPTYRLRCVVNFVVANHAEALVSGRVLALGRDSSPGNPAKNLAGYMPN
jgi:hypothetical protein